MDDIRVISQIMDGIDGPAARDPELIQICEEIQELAVRLNYADDDEVIALIEGWGEKLGNLASRYTGGPITKAVAASQKELKNDLRVGGPTHAMKRIAGILRHHDVSNNRAGYKSLEALSHWFKQAAVDLTGSKDDETRTLGKFFALLGDAGDQEYKAMITGTVPQKMVIDRRLAQMLSSIGYKGKVRDSRQQVGA